MKIGFISTTFPADLQRSVFGLHKRMGMFILAMKEMSKLDLLFSVSIELTLNEHFVAQMRERLSKH